jgi:hypothetical protein
MKRHTVKDPINHDGKSYAPGSTIDLDEAAAATLVALGVIDEGSAIDVGGGEEKEAGKPKAPEKGKPAA